MLKAHRNTLLMVSLLCSSNSAQGLQSEGPCRFW